MLAVIEKTTRPYHARDSVNGVGNFAADFLQSNAQSSFIADGYGSVAQETSNSITKNYTYRADARTSGFQSGNLSANYFFDALDRRIAKSFNDNGQNYTQSYLFQDKEDRVLLAKAGNGDIYTYIDGQGIDEHLGHLNGITAKYYVTDHLGSVLNGEAAGVGKTFGHSGELVSAPALSSSSNPSLYGFAGGTHNQESNTITFGVRDYDANTGRWNSQDPIGLSSGDLNRNRYVGNRSLIYTDPSGNISFLITGLYGAVAGGVGAYITAHLQPNASNKDIAKAVLIGTGVGFAVGTVNPLLAQAAGGLVGSAIVGQTIATAVTGGTASYLGQVVGNKGSIRGVSYGAVAGAAAGGLLVGGALSSSAVYGPGLATSIAEGVIGAGAETAGYGLGNYYNYQNPQKVSCP